MSIAGAPEAVTWHRVLGSADELPEVRVRTVTAWRKSIALTHYHYDTFIAFDEVNDINETVQFTLDGDGNVKTMSIFGQEFVRQ